MLSSSSGALMMDRRWKTNIEIAPNCPRCASTNTKFCYYNNYSLSQPRYFCKSCRRYWTKGGSLRNVPFGGGSRKSRTRSTSNNSTNKPQKPQQQSSTHPIGNSSTTGSDNIDLADVFSKFLGPGQGPLLPQFNPESADHHNSSSSSSVDLGLLLPGEKDQYGSNLGLEDLGDYGLQELLSDAFAGRDASWEFPGLMYSEEGAVLVPDDDYSMFLGSNVPLQENWGSFDIPSYGA